MNLLITGAWQGAKDNIHKLEQMGHRVSFLQYEKDEPPCGYDWVEGTVCNGLFQSHPIEAFKNLRYIQLTSAGLDRVPVEYVRSHGIKLYNARGVYSVPMAEFAVGGVLQLYKRASFFRENQKRHRWEKNRELLELYGKTVCIVGCGSVGTECARRFGAFGCKVIGVNRHPKQDENYRSIVPIEWLPELLPETDILVLAVPLTAETTGLINAEKLSAMKRGAVLVNVARGAVVDERALETALDTGLGGAVLDVFEEEPLSDASPLWDRDNVILTPHNSFVGEGNAERMTAVVLENLRALD